MSEIVPVWKRAWREGFVPNLSTANLLALRDGLARNDQRLIQGGTSIPPPMAVTESWSVECACAIGYAGWHGDDLSTVGEVEEFFCRMVLECDSKLGEPAGCRFFLNWYDDTPREQMIAELLAEVEFNLESRSAISY